MRSPSSILAAGARRRPIGDQLDLDRVDALRAGAAGAGAASGAGVRERAPTGGAPSAGRERDRESPAPPHARRRPDERRRNATVDGADRWIRELRRPSMPAMLPDPVATSRGPARPSA
jgi:hypothetical protein